MDIAKFLQQASSKPGLFSITSRYNHLPSGTVNCNNGLVVYVCRRFLPQADNFSLLQLHTVKEGERTDNIANEFLGDPEKFWQLCDANNVMHPLELTETPGAEIKITLPEGIPGYNNA